jgi:tetratricopeptide (TPR) repeat protein
MPPRSYYDILGLPRSATPAEIKKRYRQLARKYHPDVLQDRGQSSSVFIEINEAYRTLSDPAKRRAYDAMLPPEPVAGAPTTPSSSSAQVHSVSPEVRRLVQQAERAFISRKPNKAVELCKEAIRLDMRCARAHAILGDIYRSRKLYNYAIKEYSYAVQFDPADRESQAKLESLLSRTAPITFSWETPEGRMTSQAIAANVLGWGLAFFLLFLIYIYPGKPITWFDMYNLPMVQKWSWNLVGIMFGDAILVGLLLSINGLVRHPDEVFLFESGTKSVGIIPAAFILLLFSPIFFFGAALFYIIITIAQGNTSASILKAMAAAFGIVLVSALMYPNDKMSVLVLGGNVVFVGEVLGWYIGSILRSES